MKYFLHIVSASCTPGRLSDVLVSSTDHSVTLLWNAPNCAVGLSEYEILYRIRPGRQSLLLTNERIFTLDDLEPGTRVEFDIRAVAVGGYMGEFTHLKAYTSEPYPYSVPMHPLYSNTTSAHAWIISQHSCYLC